MEELLTAADLSKWFKVRRQTIYMWIMRREIPFVKLPGNQTRFPRRAIEEWMESRFAKGKPISKGIYLNP
jgi:excisionase family DNA binding protein